MVVLTSFPPPTEGIKHCEPNTSAHIQTRNLGKGTLYIAESRLSWVGSSGQGFSLEYPSVSLHAVSRDLNAFPSECLYLMIDADLDDQEAGGDGSGENDDDARISEIRFVPENKDVLDQMYKAMIACQVLHRDPDDSLSEDEEGCYDDAEDDDEDEGGEYDVQAAEQCGLVNAEGGELEDGYDGGGREGNEEPMEVGQFDDAEPEH